MWKLLPRLASLFFVVLSTTHHDCSYVSTETTTIKNTQNFPLNFVQRRILSRLIWIKKIIGRPLMDRVEKSVAWKWRELSPRASFFFGVQSTLIFCWSQERAPTEKEKKKAALNKKINQKRTRNQNLHFSYLIVQVSMLSLLLLFLLSLATRRRDCFLIATRFRRLRRCFQCWWLLICWWWYRYRF